MAKLPDEVQDHIFAHATSLAMSSDTNTCAQMLSTLTLLCKASHRACKKTVHNRVMQLRSELGDVLVDKPKAVTTPITTGTRMRSIGLSPNCPLMMSKKMRFFVTPSMYMDARTGMSNDVTDTVLPRPTETTETMRRTMARLVAINPEMWARVADHASKENSRSKRPRTESAGLLSTHRNDLESLVHEEVVTCASGYYR